MRFLRLIFVVALAIVLIAVALANRETVTLSAFPANFGQYLCGRWSVGERGRPPAQPPRRPQG